MTRFLLTYLAGVAIGVVSLPAVADCKWEWLCDGRGQCRQVPVCESLYDIPPPKPEMETPKPPPMSVPPNEKAGDKGIARCEWIMRTEDGAAWSWQRACYCVDGTKRVANERPLSGLVRCDGKDQAAVQQPAS